MLESLVYLAGDPMPIGTDETVVEVLAKIQDAEDASLKAGTPSFVRLNLAKDDDTAQEFAIRTSSIAAVCSAPALEEDED